MTFALEVEQSFLGLGACVTSLIDLSGLDLLLVVVGSGCPLGLVGGAADEAGAGRQADALVKKLET